MTFFHDTRHEIGRSSFEGGQVGEGSGGIGGHRWSGGGSNQEGLGESWTQRERGRTPCWRSDAHGLRAWKPMLPCRYFCHPQSLLQT